MGERFQHLMTLHLTLVLKAEKSLPSTFIQLRSMPHDVGSFPCALLSHISRSAPSIPTRHSRSVCCGCNTPHTDTASVQLQKRGFPFKQGQGTCVIQMTKCASQPAPTAHLCQQSPEHLSTKPAGQGSWRASAAKQQQLKDQSTDLPSRHHKGLHSPLSLKVEIVAELLPLHLLMLSL